MERELTMQRRCLCCGGLIEGPAGDDAIGLDARIGLVSDECAFVCNDCTARLIQAAVLRKREMVHRKWPAPGRRDQSGVNAS